MLPLRWCSRTSVYTPVSTALFPSFKYLSITLTQHSFTVSCTKILVWSDLNTQARATESVITFFFSTSGKSHLRPSQWIENCSYTLSGQRGLGWSVSSASITADIVCHHHNRGGILKDMPAREKNKCSLQLRWWWVVVVVGWWGGLV